MGYVSIVLTDICRSFLRVSKVTGKIKTRSKPTPSENFNSHPLLALGSRDTLGAGPACRDGQLMNPIFKIYLKGDGRIAAVRYHNLFIFLTK
jgi:hypothetical protein